jgi:hypothetical protein
VAGRAGRALPGPLVAGFAVSAVGGPLALTALLVPDAAGAEGISSLGLVTLAGVLLFAAPMLVWWRFSAEIASSGGLYTLLVRLVPAMFGVPRLRAALVVGAAFVGGCLVSLIDPGKAYEYALTPALAALYVSQAFVFVAYLRFRGRPSAVDWAAAALATVLMGFGLWVVLSQQPYT